MTTVSETTGRTQALLVAGGVLIAVGAYLLLERLFAPLGVVAHALSVAAWPLALIAIGVALLGRGRFEGGIGGVYRSRSQRMVGGVLGGVATRLGAEAWLVRVAFVVLALATGLGAAALLYVAALVLLPEEPLAPVIAVPAPPAPSSAGGR